MQCFCFCQNLCFSFNQLPNQIKKYDLFSLFRLHFLKKLHKCGSCRDENDKKKLLDNLSRIDKWQKIREINFCKSPFSELFASITFAKQPKIEKFAKVSLLKVSLNKVFNHFCWDQRLRINYFLENKLFSRRCYLA